MRVAITLRQSWDNFEIVFVAVGVLFSLSKVRCRHWGLLMQNRFDRSLVGIRDVIERVKGFRIDDIICFPGRVMVFEGNRSAYQYKE